MGNLLSDKRASRTQYHAQVSSYISYHRLYLHLELLLRDLNLSDEGELDLLPALRRGLEGEESVDPHHSAGVLALGVGPVPEVIVGLGHIPAVLWTTDRKAGALTPKLTNIKI